MAWELRIPLGTGHLTCRFDGTDDLERQLASLDLEKLQNLVEKHIGGLTEPLKVKPGFETVYVPGPDGLPQLLVAAPTAPESVALALLTAEPRHLNALEICQVSGVKDAPRNYFSQAKCKSWFDKDGEGKYYLTNEGRTVALALAKRMGKSE